MSSLPVCAFRPLLRIPPFPGSGSRPLGRDAPSRSHIDDAEIDLAIEMLKRERVGGTYWGARPPLPDIPYILIRVPDRNMCAQILQALPEDQPILWWVDAASAQWEGSTSSCVRGDCDPWHLVSGAAQVIADANDELIVIAALAGAAVLPLGVGRFSGVGNEPDALRAAVREHVLRPHKYADPFSGEAIRFAEAVRLCAFWKALIDANRTIVSIMGFASWKRATAAPLLWSGRTANLFGARPVGGPKKVQIVVWKSRMERTALDALERQGAQLVEAEDGFIRSIGLGADCVPPLSLVVDGVGVYFDPTRPSELENLLQIGNFSPELLDRARLLRALIVERGVSKYSVGQRSLARRAAGRRHRLVPGQVEDDRSIQCGGGAVTTNLELLRRARQQAPGAYIVYKPHPDVEAGHRVGALATAEALKYADEIVVDQAISSLIDLVDEVHVNTSLAGFEALMRGKSVTTHGVPFYAGWGLTVDLGAVPERRSTRRTIDELVAAVLLLYPRYLDPLTGLPCTAEILVRRLSEGVGVQQPSLTVRLRRLQGAVLRRIASLRGMD